MYWSAIARRGIRKVSSDGGSEEEGENDELDEDADKRWKREKKERTDADVTSEEAERGEWVEATRSEASRLFISLVFTVGFGAFVALGGLNGGVRPALLVVILGTFVHKTASALAQTFVT
ncbi:MAG: hypothetical protein SV760_06430 [Halobacteria archaeon]|nr:hypothetical protein [Halobacteria archaeon]